MIKDLRNLPTDVLERLSAIIEDDDPGEGVRAGFDMRRGGALVDARMFRPEVRLEEDGSVIVDGYATVYDYAYDVMGGAPYGWSETIARGAATKSVQERDNVGLLINHDSATALGLPVAANWAGTLELESDRRGLRMEGSVAPGDVVSDFLIRRLERREADAMSLAFRVIRQEWNDDYTERTITELALVDVSVVNYPANPATIAQVRNERIDQLESQRVAPARFAAEAEALRLAGGLVLPN